MARSTRVEGQEVSSTATRDMGGGQAERVLEVRPGIVIALMAVSLAAAGLSTFQWLELIRVQGGGKTFCSINATFNCSSVWESAFAETVHTLTRIPIAGWGLVWAMAAFGSAAALFLRARAGTAVARAVSAVLVTSAAGILVSIGLFLISARMDVFCLTCIGTYVIVLAYAICAWRLAPLSSLKVPDFVSGAFFSGGLTLAAYGILLYPGLNTPLKAEVKVTDLKKSAPENKPSPSAGDSLATFLKGLEPDAQAYVAEALEDYRRSPARPREGWPARQVLGAQGAPLAIVEWSDIRCGHCKRFSEVLHDVAASAPEGSYSLELRQFPLDATCNGYVPKQMTDSSGVRCTAAKALICLEGRPEFRETQEKLFDDQENLTRDRVLEVASRGGLNRSALEACIESPATAAALKSDVDFAMAYAIEGTPLIVMNGRVAEGGSPFVYAMVIAGGDPSAPGWSVLPAPPPKQPE